MLSTLCGCALLARPSMREITNEFALDLLSRMLTALDASDFEYFYSCFDLESLAAARGMTPIGPNTLPHIKRTIREHYERMQVLKGKLGNSLRLYGAIGTRVGTFQMSVAGAVSSTPLEGCGTPPGAPSVSRSRGYWLLEMNGTKVKVRLRRTGNWAIEDMEWQ